MIFSKKNQRALSAFVSQEMLFDYMNGNLDSDREKSIRQALDSDPHLRSLHEKMKEGQSYLRSLSQVQITPQLANELKKPTTYLDELLRKTQFAQWPDGLKYALEGLFIAMFSAIFIILIPWGRLMDRVGAYQNAPVVLAEIPKTKPTDLSVEAAVESAAVKPPEPVKAESAAPVSQAAPAPATVPAKTALKKPVPVPKSEPQKMAQASAPDSGKKQGFIYRGVLDVVDPDEAAASLKEFIIAHQGQKAGEVELGWKKGTGRYFHFVVPGDSYQDLVDQLSAFGQLKLQKEVHPRVMQNGQIRLIITIDEKK